MNTERLVKSEPVIARPKTDATKEIVSEEIARPHERMGINPRTSMLKNSDSQLSSLPTSQRYNAGNLRNTFDTKYSSFQDSRPSTSRDYDTNELYGKYSETPRNKNERNQTEVFPVRRSSSNGSDELNSGDRDSIDDKIHYPPSSNETRMSSYVQYPRGNPDGSIENKEMTDSYDRSSSSYSNIHYPPLSHQTNKRNPR